MRLLVIDTETTGTDWKTDKLHGIGLCWGPGADEADYYPIWDMPDGVRRGLMDPTIIKVGHNIRFDLKFLKAAGFEVQGDFYDTMLLAQILDENQPMGLKALTEKYLGAGRLSSKADLDRACSRVAVKHVGELCAADLADGDHGHAELIGRYCIEDVRNTRDLWQYLTKRVNEVDGLVKQHLLGAKATPKDYFLQEAAPLEPILLDMEMSGIAVDRAAMGAAAKEFKAQELGLFETLNTLCKEEVHAIEDKLYEAAVAKRKSDKGKASVRPSDDKYGTRFNWDSSAHCAQLFFEELKAPSGLVRTTATGKPSTNNKDLSALRHLVPADSKLSHALHLFHDYKKATKLTSTYAGEDSGLFSQVHAGRIHSNYFQAGASKEGAKGGTTTGRLSSQNPNMQNLPRGGAIKRFFVPDPGHKFLYFDYSQLELRIAAHLSKDKEFLDAYNVGLDLHKLTAGSVFGVGADKVTKEQRQVGKVINFALIYNAGSWRLMEELNKGGAAYSIEDVEDMRKAFFRRYSGYDNYLKAQRKLMERNLLVITEFGRIRHLPELAYGQYLDWSKRAFTGPHAMIGRLQRYLEGARQPATQQGLFMAAKKIYKHAINQGYNFPIQSFGASLTKRAMIALHKAGFKVSTQVHDSIILQVPVDDNDSVRFAERIMQGVYKLDVPLIAEGKVLRSLDEYDMFSTIIQAGAVPILEPTDKEANNESTGSSIRNEEHSKAH